MSTVSTIRNRLDTKLDQWEANALALQAQLVSTRGEIQERIETHKHRLARLTHQMESFIDRSEVLGPQSRSRLHDRMEQLKLQLALGSAEARDSFVEQKQMIGSAMAALEERIDHDLESADALLTDLIDRWVHEEIALQAELEAAELHFDLETARRRAQLDDVFQEQKQQIMSKLNDIRHEIDIERQTAASKVELLEDELNSGIHQVRDAFRKLVS